ncbi:CoA-transferase family III [Saitoella complicata NRRL Y-17804]|uniref:CoA-transferase family III n=1 Tax=Saitoella complicata (strain BCRC 22490 / CBS 7301 / JCM 7358 / NBRC 10748 / NRRL Y-17804) TaxID=698492 RepID=A0A0E9NKQ5_SAICN|nr:CoA-transferase family III [Saitoella complicata NRRL Y-17804]ODQ55152.1 CoA-transferase family III [Saitoella complicata NRRL Y-17804]GAO49990.1 hypothetical protein G7K_4125-t1 [Saitoella complicata NRRL Y-17804]
MIRSHLFRLPSRRIAVISLARRFNAHAAVSPKKPDTAPLSHIRVLDLTRVLAGPYCTMLLADLGAEVIKIEHPVRGDDTRAWGPPFAAPLPEVEQALEEGYHGESAYFLSVNRNKKSLALSFQNEGGRRALRRLAAECDVLVENYLPGTLARYGLGYDDLRKINPRLIYASITGYGQSGPYSSRAGYDVMVEAEMGLMHITGEQDSSPVKVGVAVTDLTTGLYAQSAILASLYGQERRGGRGEWLDLALSDCQVATLTNIASSALISGMGGKGEMKDSGRWGTAHPSIVPYRGFETMDGYMMIGGANDNLFGKLCRVLGTEEWITDPRFVTNRDRVKNRDLLEELIETRLKTQPTKYWTDALEGTGMAYAIVNNIPQTLSHPHVLARSMIQETPSHPICGPLPVLGPAVKYSESTVGVRMPPPVLGQHSREVLMGLCGMSQEEVQKGVEEGWVRCWDGVHAGEQDDGNGNGSRVKLVE